MALHYEKPCFIYSVSMTFTTFIHEFLPTFYIFFPAFFANAAPVLVGPIALLRPLKIPISKRFLGAHKTFRGLFSGIVFGAATGALQFTVRQFLPLEYTFLHSTIIDSVFFGALLGAGALIGDIVKSFFKRLLSIPPGRPFIMVDGIDYVLGSLLFVAPMYSPPLGHCIALIILGPILSLIANIIAYALALKETWN